jgi:hypothetical protein
MSLTNKTFSLDLDASLLSTSNNMSVFNGLKIYTDPSRYHLRDRLYYIDLTDVCEKPGKGTRYKMWGVFRPHLFEFIEFLFKYCKCIMVWSAGRPKYVTSICNILFPFEGKQPLLVYTYDDLLIDKKDKIFKPLDKAFEDPMAKGAFTHENTFHLDDRTDVISLNPNNGIHIPAYGPDGGDDKTMTIADIMTDDPSLIQLKYWLLLPEVMAAQDVRHLDKSRIFKTPIQEYQKILNGTPEVFPAKPEEDVETYEDLGLK